MSRLAAILLALALAACGAIGIEPDEARRPGASSRGASIVTVDGVRYAVVQPGDTLYGLAEQTNSTRRQLTALNDLPDPDRLAAGQRIRLPPDQQLHKVRSGETLSDIAARYRVSPAELASANAVTPGYKTRSGEFLGVPTGSGVVASTPRTNPARARPTDAPRNDRVEVASLPPVETPSSPEPRPASPAPTPIPATEASPRPPPPVAAPKPAAAEPPLSSAPASNSSTGVAASTPRPPSRPPPAPPAAGVAAASPPGPGVATPGKSGGFLAPLEGPVIASFGSQADGRRNDGVNIAAAKGAAVRAAGDGEVVYAGDALQGYGNLVLVRHSDGWVTAYAHLDDILSRRGERVRRGQTIGTVGTTGGVAKPQLHFEMRLNNKAVDPKGRLAAT